MWTLGCPFINKGIELHKAWLANLKRVILPRHEMKLLFVDMCKTPEITALYKDYLDKHGSEWLKVEYVKDPPKENPDVPESPGLFDGAIFFDKRKTIAESTEIVNKHREGNLLLWEDDIIVPHDAWEQMIPVFHSDDSIWSVGGVQYTRSYRWNYGKMLLVWDIKNYQPVPRHWDNEKDEGVEFVGATATGFQLYKEKFLNEYNFYTETYKGQDIITGLNINKRGGKVALVWNMKFPHLLYDKELLVFRSPKCKTPVLNDEGRWIGKTYAYPDEPIRKRPSPSPFHE